MQAGGPKPAPRAGGAQALLERAAVVAVDVFAGRLASGIGAPLRGVSMAAKLARRNAARNPKRTAAIASALMIGLALVGLVSILGESAKAPQSRWSTSRSEPTSPSPPAGYRPGS